MKRYFVYIAGSHSGTLYVGLTNDISRRMYEHRNHLIPGFTDRYDVTKLLYVEESNDVLAAISREKQIKRWRREKKVRLIREQNPGRRDLVSD